MTDSKNQQALMSILLSPSGDPQEFAENLKKAIESAIEDDTRELDENLVEMFFKSKEVEEHLTGAEISEVRQKVSEYNDKV